MSKLSETSGNLAQWLDLRPERPTAGVGLSRVALKGTLLDRVDQILQGQGRSTISLF